jgi:hypothetical protein
MSLESIVLIDLMHRVERLENRVRSAAQIDTGPDTVDRLRTRVQHLERHTYDADNCEPEPDDAELERSGNVVCMPGVKLADVQRPRRRTQ